MALSATDCEEDGVNEHWLCASFSFLVFGLVLVLVLVLFFSLQL